jgi:hypothetical protein
VSKGSAGQALLPALAWPAVLVAVLVALSAGLPRAYRGLAR